MANIRLLRITNYNENVYKEFRELISKEKCLRIDQYRFVEDYQRSILADVLARKMIEPITGIEAQKIDIRIGKYGKPYVFNSKGVYFNVSHSGEYVACIVSKRPC